jgi:hypothetical protein
MFSPSFNGTIIIINNSVFKRGAKLEIEKLFSKLLSIKISHIVSFLLFCKSVMLLIYGFVFTKNTTFPDKFQIKEFKIIMMKFDLRYQIIPTLKGARGIAVNLRSAEFL